MNGTALDALQAPGALNVVFQPIFDLGAAGRRVHAYEALTRGPRFTNFASAGVLFDYVRRKRSEPAIDRLCAREALRAQALLPEREAAISINYHASTLSRDTQAAEELLEDAASRGLQGRRLIVEIVEHSPTLSTKTLHASLRMLRAAGAEIALDDLGLGNSNYKMLLDIRPEYLKLDRYIISGCHRDAYRRAVVRSLAELAAEVSCRVVAEGVELPEELDTLRGLNVSLVQGYLLGLPLPADGQPRGFWKVAANG